MRIATGIFLVLTLNTSAFGQWAQIERLPNQSQEWQIGGSFLYNGGGDVVVASNGDIIVFYTENGTITDPRPFPPEGTPALLKMARSTDSGATWIEPVSVRAGAGPINFQGIGPATAAINPVSGRITLMFYFDAPPSFEAWNSDDNGETWTLAGTSLESPGLGDWEFTVGGLEYSPNGLLIVSDVEDTYEGVLQFVINTSADDGATWTTAARIEAPPKGFCDNSLIAFSDSDWLVFMSDCHIGLLAGTTTLTSIRTGDGGATWSEPTEVLTRSTGYSPRLDAVDLVLAADSTLWLTYTHGARASIYYKKSADKGTTWTSPERLTYGATDGWQECTDAVGGPLCVFTAIGRAIDSRLPELFTGQLGVSQDPLVATAAEDVVIGIPGSFTLSQNYPNPFNPSTTVSFELDRSQQVHVTLHDAIGRQVRELAGGLKAAGRHDVTVDASELPSGTYIYRLRTENGLAARLMTVLK